METLSYILSILSLVSTVISFLIKGRRMKLILFFVALGNALMACSYLCITNMTGACTCFIGTVQTLINYFYERKDKAIPLWLMGAYAVTIIVANLFVFSAWYDILAILASLISIMIISSKNGKIFRRWALTNNITWCIYDLISHSSGALISHLVMTGFTAVGIIMHDLKKTESVK